MGLLNKLFHKTDDAPSATDDVVCYHKMLTARWDSTDDIGKEERATSFQCESCGESFSGDEGRRLLHDSRNPVGLA